MSSSEIILQNHNTYTTKLSDLISTLNEEQQRYLLKNVEKFILIEKRTSARKICRIPVRYIYKDKIYNSLIVNISREGCFIETQKPLSPGERILMDIQLQDDDKSFKINGEVANTNRIGMGVEFDEVSNDLLNKLGYLLYKII
jgi:Tfp pilus assembly protein PilZ